MPHQSPGARTESTGCLLPIQSISLSHAPLQSDHPLYNRFNDLIEVAAIEYLEGRTRHLTGSTYTASLIALHVILRKKSGTQWRASLEDCAEGFGNPTIIWPIRGDGDRGPVYDAMDYHVGMIIDEAKSTPGVMGDSFMSIRAKLQTASNHVRLRMDRTRRKMLAEHQTHAYKGRP